MYQMESAPGPKTIIDGREIDYFCGTGYFTFQGHPEIVKAAWSKNMVDVLAAIGAVSDEDVLILKLTGRLIDGTPISGKDVVIIKKKK